VATDAEPIAFDQERLGPEVPVDHAQLVAGAEAVEQAADPAERELVVDGAPGQAGLEHLAGQRLGDEHGAPVDDQHLEQGDHVGVAEPHHGERGEGARELLLGHVEEARGPLRPVGGHHPVPRGEADHAEALADAVGPERAPRRIFLRVHRSPRRILLQSVPRTLTPTCSG
jgi:hypothetical protein